MDNLMELYEYQRPYMPFVLAAGGAFFAAKWFVQWFTKRMRPTGIGSVTAPPNTPIIYQFPRGPFAPSLSPFPVKLETYCRIANIPYKTDCTGRFSSRDKIPWMTYNGEVVEDSQFCIEYLNKAMGVDLNSHLDDKEKATARMIQVLVDEHLYWAMALFRWVYHDKSFPDIAKEQIKGMSNFRLRMLKGLISKQAHGQGMGRHSKEEVKRIMMTDLKSLSDFLGDKLYMLGDKMCQADCSVFGMLSQMEFHHFHSAVAYLLENEFPNLHEYVLRIKDEVWPDWNQISGLNRRNSYVK